MVRRSSGNPAHASVEEPSKSVESWLFAGRYGRRVQIQIDQTNPYYSGLPRGHLKSNRGDAPFGTRDSWFRIHDIEDIEIGTDVFVCIELPRCHSVDLIMRPERLGYSAQVVP
jgi:hypothetical protein